MINDRMKLYKIETRVSGYDDYGEPLTSFTFYKDVEISISLITKIINELDPRYIKATHIGLTYDKSLKEDMRISNINEAFTVKIVNGDGRMSQLTLEVT